ncbi:uncharacterized protein LOC144059286 [Vanacampus margaritifer]
MYAGQRHGGAGRWGIGGLAGGVLLMGMFVLCWEPIWTATIGRTLGNVGRFRLWWRNAADNRTQEDFTCPGGQPCLVANVSSNCLLQVCRKCFSGQDIPVIAKGCQLTVKATCSLCEYDRKKRNCTKNSNGTDWTITVSQDTWIANGSEITGGSTVGYVIWVSPNTTTTNVTTHVVPIVPTCMKMAHGLIRTEVRWTIKFSILPECHRARRAWYDTLLGRTGTLLGSANLIDNQITTSKLHYTGQYTHDALVKVAQWLPTAVQVQAQNVLLWKKQVQFQEKVNNSTGEVLQNMTDWMNWTACSCNTYMPKDKEIDLKQL